MAEIFTTDAPVQADPGASTFRVASHLLVWDGPFVEIVLREWADGTFRGRRIRITYDGAAAVAILRVVSRGEFAPSSLHGWLLARCQADGKLPAGQRTGTPD